MAGNVIVRTTTGSEFQFSGVRPQDEGKLANEWMILLGEPVEVRRVEEQQGDEASGRE